MNNTIGLSFKEIFTEKSSYRFYEQCTKSTKKCTRWETCKTYFLNPNIKVYLNIAYY